MNDHANRDDAIKKEINCMYSFLRIRRQVRELTIYEYEFWVMQEKKQVKIGLTEQVVLDWRKIIMIRL